MRKCRKDCIYGLLMSFFSLQVDITTALYVSLVRGAVGSYV